MLAVYRDSRRQRLASAAGVVAMHLGLAWLLISGLGADMVRGVSDSLHTFDVAPPPPPPPPVEAPAPQVQRAAPEEAAPDPPAPPAPAAERPAPAAEPAPASDVPPPVAAGLVPSGPAGGGAADTGSGSGAGGSGSGTGGGGSGTGGGGSRAVMISGEIVRSDYPRAAVQTRAEGRVVVSFLVGTDGRVSNCRVTRSSGSAALDQTTCRLVEQRFRWNPARDAQGNPVAEERGWQQIWWFDRRTRTTRRPVPPEKAPSEPQNVSREEVE